MRSAQDIHSLYLERRGNRAPIYAIMQQVKSLYNAELAVPLPEMDRDEQATVVNLLKQGIDGTAQRINSTLPDIYYPPLKPGQKTSEKQAETARRANLGWWSVNDMHDVLARRYRHFLGYGCSPVVLRPDATFRHARWEVRDPLSAYPAPTARMDSCTPQDVIFTYQRTPLWLARNYPGMGLYLNDKTPDAKITCLEYLSPEETVLIAIGHDRDPHDTYSPGLACAELLRVPNPTGMTLAVMPGRITLDRMAGQFDGLIPMYFKQAKLDALEYIAIEQGVFPRSWLVARQGETPKVEVVADGRKGIIGVVRGGDLREENLNPGYKTSQAIDRLAGEQRLEGNVPAEMQGVSAENIRTGRRGDQVLSNGIDFGIQEAQRQFEISLREENKRAVAITKAFFGNEKKSFYVEWRGASGPVEYIPNEIFASDHNVVKYALAGSDLNSQVVRLGQKLGAGLISKATARKNDPEIGDPGFEEFQINVEMAESAFAQGLFQQMSTGAFPPADAARFVQLLKEKVDPIEAFQKVQEEAQQRQATAGTPGTPEGPVEPTSPEAMPGVSPGSEAGVSIPEPLSAQQNLHQILGNAGQARMAIRQGAV